MLYFVDELFCLIRERCDTVVDKGNGSGFLMQIATILTIDIQRYLYLFFKAMPYRKNTLI